MQATYTNPESGQQIAVFVHSRFEQHGEAWATVNKGHVKSRMTFNVRTEALS